MFLLTFTSTLRRLGHFHLCFFLSLIFFLNFIFCLYVSKLSTAASVCHPEKVSFSSIGAGLHFFFFNYIYLYLQMHWFSGNSHRRNTEMQYIFTHNRERLVVILGVTFLLPCLCVHIIQQCIRPFSSLYLLWRIDWIDCEALPTVVQCIIIVNTDFCCLRCILFFLTQLINAQQVH